MQVFYSPRYYADIGQGHIFPIRKFELVRDRLHAKGALHPDEIGEPSPATLDQVLLVHAEERQCYEREVPVVTVMSGGYGKDINDTIVIHCNTIRAVKAVFESHFAARRRA